MNLVQQGYTYRPLGSAKKIDFFRGHFASFSYFILFFSIAFMIFIFIFQISNLSVIYFVFLFPLVKFYCVIIINSCYLWLVQKDLKILVFKLLEIFIFENDQNFLYFVNKIGFFIFKTFAICCKFIYIQSNNQNLHFFNCYLFTNFSKQSNKSRT